MLFCEESITIVLVLTGLFKAILLIALSVAVIFGGGGSPAVSRSTPPKDEENLKKWLNKLADTLKRPAGKAVEALPAIVGSVVDAILSFLYKPVGFVVEDTWAPFVVVAGLIGVLLLQEVKSRLSDNSLNCHGHETVQTITQMPSYVYSHYTTQQGHHHHQSPQAIHV